MAIVCGTDFSPAAQRAAEFAGLLAQKWGTSLVLAHAFDPQDFPAYGPLKEELTGAVRVALEAECERLRSRGVQTEARLLIGKPDETLAQLAGAEQATLIVVAALGSRNAAEWQLGGSADRISQLSTVPVFVVRDPEPLQRWLEGRRALQVVLGVDRTNISQDAIRFASELRKAGPVDVDVLHLFWAADEFRRLGFSGVRSLVDADPNVERILLRELEAEVGTFPGQGRLNLHVEVCFGRASERIVSFAERAGSDVIIVGSHRRNLLSRLWSGSTSRAVLHEAGTSVVCVTAAPHRELEQRPIPEFRSVLVATDFSETGDAAVRWAYGLLKSGGVVHLITVVHPKGPPAPVVPKDLFDGPVSPVDAAQLQAAERDLKLREPDEARGHGIATHVKAISSSKVAEALIQAAERLSVDAVVMGTHGRSGIARAVLGSVAQDVGARCGRPVLLVHPAAG